MDDNEYIIYNSNLDKEIISYRLNKEEIITLKGKMLYNTKI